MSDDELQAIEYWKEKLKDYKKEIEQRQNDEFKGYGTLEDIAKLKYCNLHIMLNLIEKEQREKELHIKLEQQYKKEYLDAKERIKELQTTLATYTAHTVCSDIKQSYKHKEDLEMLYKGCQIELEEKDKYINILENKLMYALSPTTHELALNTQEQFKAIIRENLEEDTYTIKRALKEYWKTFK